MKIKFACAAAAVAVAFASNVALTMPAPARIHVTGSAASFRSIVSAVFRSRTTSRGQASITVSQVGLLRRDLGSSASGNSTVNIGGSEIDVYGGYTHAIGKTGSPSTAVCMAIYPGQRSERIFRTLWLADQGLWPVSAKAGLNWAPKQSYFTWNTARRTTCMSTSSSLPCKTLPRCTAISATRRRVQLCEGISRLHGGRFLQVEGADLDSRRWAPK
jgi:hypothetical protein